MFPPMDELTQDQAHDIWRQAESLKRISDRLIGIGPFGVGLDGVTALIPVAGTVYSALAGGWVMWLGVKAKASPLTLVRMLAYVAADTISSDIPIIGQAADFFFQGHLMAANALQKDIVKRHGAPVEAMRHAGRGSSARAASSAQPA